MNKILLPIILILSLSSAVFAADDTLSKTGHICICSKYKMTNESISIVPKIYAAISYADLDDPKGIYTEDVLESCLLKLDLFEKAFNCNVKNNINLEEISSNLKDVDFDKNSEILKKEYAN